MKKNKLAKPTAASSQKYLDIAEIRDNVVVMKDSSLRAVLLVSSINFSLKSEEEQDAIISAYASFLNSLEFPVQIIIQSRPINIDNYLAYLSGIKNEQTNELLKMQTAEYIDYISELVKMGEIMTKRFYVVITYNPMAPSKKGFFDQFLSVFKLSTQIKLNQEKFEKFKEEISTRANLVAGALGSMGVNSNPLDTQSLVELYYGSYNPQISEEQKAGELDKVQVGE
ncbi:hypothetical protein HQ544_00815 [Candidatus Falkowbacteria bacterium]|nr:hypothetical protein [Candidatus Falkowbacteria bacterium]